MWTVCLCLAVALETVLLLVFVVSLPDFNAGNGLGIFGSLVLLGLTLNFGRVKKLAGLAWQNAWGKLGLIALGAVVCFGLIFVAVNSVKMLRAMKNYPTAPNTVIVLGCRVKEQRPSRMLRRRLDTAYGYLAENSRVICIVSGGKGSDETISEALAMKKYLVQKGLDPDRIIMEDRSASTAENLKFSMEIIDGLGLERNVTLVTDGFHQYRAGLIAKKQGAGQVNALSARTNPRFLPTYWVRELLAIGKFKLL